MRLQKFIAEAGLCSRRKAEEFIKEGLIRVNGKVVFEMGIIIDPKVDAVTYKNKKLTSVEEKFFIMLNKPTGFVTTVKDDKNRPTVMQLLTGIHTRVFPIGRLDMDSKGLLLLTNDGEISNILSHPKYEVEKTYLVKVQGFPTEKKLNLLKTGIIIDENKTVKAKLSLNKEGKSWSIYMVSIKEGRNRQIRKMFSAIDHNVLELKRISYGELHLKNLNEGNWRFLTDKEIDYLNDLRG